MTDQDMIGWIEAASLDALMAQAAEKRDAAHGRLVSYSRKVFIPLTKLCRDVCHYCTFAERPRSGRPAYLSPEAVLTIARAGAAAGCTEALFTLGDKPELRYRAAREAAAIFDSNWHTIVELTGPDRVRYLNAIVSGDVKSLGEGRGIFALLLTPQGHILAELEIYALPDKLLVLSHASVRERTVATLDKFIIMDDVTLSDVTERFGSLAIEGPRAGTVIAEACDIEFQGF